jgi:hypothetical protein
MTGILSKTSMMVKASFTTLQDILTLYKYAKADYKKSSLDQIKLFENKDWVFTIHQELLPFLTIQPIKNSTMNSS